MGYNKGTVFERQLKHLLEAKGFFVVRASGSGADGISPDLIALHTTRKIAIECKAWKNNLHLEKPKVETMKQWEQTTGMPVFIAWKSPRKEWRFFPLSVLKQTEHGFTLSREMLPIGMTLEEVLK
ncbi:MAG: Holliday junction resolvase Hjc [Candidatus Micrarchaeota archaeon]